MLHSFSQFKFLFKNAKSVFTAQDSKIFFTNFAIRQPIDKIMHAPITLGKNAQSLFNILKIGSAIEEAPTAAQIPGTNKSNTAKYPSSPIKPATSSALSLSFKNGSLNTAEEINFFTHFAIKTAITNSRIAFTIPAKPTPNKFPIVLNKFSNIRNTPFPCYLIIYLYTAKQMIHVKSCFTGKQIKNKTHKIKTEKVKLPFCFYYKLICNINQ